MKLLVAVISAALFLTACGDGDSSSQNTAVNVTIPKGTPTPPGGFGNEDEMKCKTNSNYFGKDDVESAQLCKSRLGQETCERFFAKAACDAPPEN